MGKQLLLGGSSAHSVGSQSFDWYDNGDGRNWSSQNRNIRIGCPGTIRNWRMKLSTPCGVGNGRTFAFYKNSANSGWQLVFGETDTLLFENTASLLLAIGDSSRMRLVSTTGTPPTQQAMWCSEFESDNPNETTHGTGTESTGVDAIPTSTPSWGGLVGDINWRSSDDVGIVCPIAGIIKNLFFFVLTAPGSGKSWELEIFKNGQPTGLKCTISDTGTTNTNLVNTFSVVAGDRLSFKITPSGTPANTVVNVGWCFETENDGDFVWFSFTETQDNADNRYMSISGRTSPSSTSTARRMMTSACYLKKFAVKLQDAPAVGNSRTFVIRKNGEDTSLSVTLSDTETYKEVEVVIQCADYDELDIKETIMGTPTTTRFMMATVVAFDPPSSDSSITYKFSKYTGKYELFNADPTDQDLLNIALGKEHTKFQL